MRSLKTWYSKNFYSYAEAKTWLTTNFYLIIGGLGTVWAALPDDAKALVVTAIFSRFQFPTSWVVVAVAIVGLVLRFKKQKPAEPPAVEAPVDPLGGDTVPMADPVDLERMKREPGPL